MPEDGAPRPWEYDVENDLFTFTDSFYAIFRTTAEQGGGYAMSSADYTKRFVHPEMHLLSVWKSKRPSKPMIPISAGNWNIVFFMRMERLDTSRCNFLLSKTVRGEPSEPTV